MTNDVVIVAEPVTDTRLLSPEAVTVQYHKAVSGCLEMVRFGAMMIEVNSSLTRETGARGGGHTPREETLKGWLDDNCPEVNYKTALRFLSLAQGVQRACNLPAAMPMTLALPGPDGCIDVDAEWTRQGPGRPVSAERLAELRGSVWELVQGKSARQLLFQFMAPEVAKGGARPPAAFNPNQAHDDTVYLWTDHVRWMAKSIKHKEHLLLTAGELKGMRDELLAVADDLRLAMSREDRDAIVSMN